MKIGMALSVLLLSGAASAMTIAGNPSKCDQLAGDVITIVGLRDQGMTVEEFHRQVDPQIPSVKGSSTSYMVDDEDVKMTMDTFEWVFEHPDVDAKHAMQFIQRACMKYGEMLDQQKAKQRARTRLQT